nr:hypothetical protein [Candidatus Gracilibacteria bacterium]
MFDIISFIREKIFRRSKLTSELAGEELSEKQTTKLGYFLLFCMFGAIMTSAQWTLSIIKGIPDSPTNIPYCINNVINAFDEKNNSNYYSYGDYNGYNYSYNGYNDCQLTSTNPKFDFTTEYNNLLKPYEEIKNYKNLLQTLTSSKTTLEYNQKNSREDYNTSLAEKIANEKSGMYNTNDIQNKLQDNQSQLQSVESQITDYTNKIKDIQTTYKSEVSNLIQKLDKANSDYRTAYLLYRLYVAILSFIFSIVVFTILYKIYVAQKIKNSPHTIIFSVATFAYGLILTQISAMFIWDIIPHKLIELIQKLFSLFTPLVYLVQFLWPVIIIAIFGFLVYKIQKRLYSPKNVLKRFISDRKCPNCGNSVDFTKPFCPLCSHEIQIHCPHCHELTLKGMPYCSNCGGKLPEHDIISYSNTKVFDDTLKNELEDININEFSGVRFIPNEGSAFTSTRENIVKVSAYMINKLGKTKFEPNEFLPYLEKIEVHINKDSLSKNELNRILGKIKSWIKSGGEVKMIKK